MSEATCQIYKNISIFSKYSARFFSSRLVRPLAPPGGAAEFYKNCVY
jgi:hypothetical protein